MAKASTILIKMESTSNTGYYYVPKKNPRTQTEKLELHKGEWDYERPEASDGTV